MAKSSKKIIRSVILVIVGLIITAFLLNWYFTYRLEKYLKDELAHIISDETDGFYKLEFSDLKIDFFSGELLMQDVTLAPDSIVFSKFEQKDSLPSVYLDLSLGSIHFKGINLVWRIDYTQLHFELFEIKNTNLNVYEIGRTPTDSEDSIDNKKEFQNLYDLISPYIDVLTAGQMNLTNASFTFNLNKDQNPTKYSLRDINFRVHGFILDKNSSKSGKLLYSDDFEFVADRPQLLLSNDQFELKTKNILFSTKDSVILIEGIRLIPQTALIADSFNIINNYADAMIKKVEVNGIHFKRKDAQNYLDAKSLNIISSKIEYYNAQDFNQDPIEPNVNISDSLTSSWSLYGFISPLLKEVAIDKILIDSTQFKYTDDSKGKKDVYSMDKFRFIANKFRVDSVSNPQDRLLYSDNFSVNAAGIKGIVRSKNQKANIDYLYLNVAEGNFILGELKLDPLDKDSKNEYLSGVIKGLTITGLKYKKGLEIKKLLIDNPKIEYVSPLSRPSITNKKMDLENPNEIFSSFFRYLHVKNFNLNNAYITYNDRENNNIYKLNKLNFWATDFFLNRQKKHKKYEFFNFSEFGVSFIDFDNYLPNKHHHLKIAEASFDSNTGLLILKRLKLTPQFQNKQVSTYFDLAIPNLLVEGLYYKKQQNNEVNNLRRFNIDSLYLRIVKMDNEKTLDRSKELFKIPTGYVERIDIGNVDFTYLDKLKDDSIDVRLKRFTLNNAAYSENKELALKGLTVSKIALRMSQSGRNLNAISDSIVLSELRWKPKENFDLGFLDIKSPKMQILPSRIEKSNKLKKSRGDLYDEVGKWAEKVNLNQVKIDDATFDYKRINDLLSEDNKLGKISLALSGFSLNTREKNFGFEDIQFNTSNLKIPLDNGFYTLHLGNIDFRKGGLLRMNDLKLVAAYPKMDFAYKHPRKKDWFDVSVRNVELKGLDYPTFFNRKKLNIKKVDISGVSIQNFKNQKVNITHNLMPMIYEGLQKFPLKLNVDTVDVRNVDVVYEELTEKGTVPGKLFFTDMNGMFTGFTNEATRRQQYINLDADGKLMGSGDFTANWKLPVDSSFDSFLLSAHLKNFDLRDLNQLLTPMFPARVSGGAISDLKFNASASSIGANVDMTMLYNDLELELLKNKEGKFVKNGFSTWGANLIIRDNNPDKVNKNPRQPSLTITRDPYHSTFNYIWQILKPPVIESVGISKEKQDLMSGVTGFFQKIKNFFGGGRKEDKKDKKGKSDKK